MVGKKLLVVDDSLTIQKVIRLALSNEGYEIQACSDGNDAIQQISLFRPDAVLIDVSLPGKSAFEVKAETNRLSDLKGLKYVLMASAFEQVDEAQVTLVGFEARLVKPFDPAHLRQVLTEVLADKKPSPKKEADAPEIPEPEAPMSTLAPNEAGEESDIKQLTESTIKMSGLDEYQWSVNEMGKSGLSDEPALPPSSLIEAPEFKKEAFGDLPITPPPSKQEAPSVAVSPLSTSEVEEALRKHLGNTLEQMAKKILPEIAEKVIKQEIRKMLSDHP